METPMPPVQYKKSFYAIGTREERVADVEFFRGFTPRTTQIVANFSKLNLESDSGPVWVFGSLEAAREALPTARHWNNKPVEVIAL